MSVNPFFVGGDNSKLPIYLCIISIKLISTLIREFLESKSEVIFTARSTHFQRKVHCSIATTGLVGSGQKCTESEKLRIGIRSDEIIAYIQHFCNYASCDLPDTLREH